MSSVLEDLEELFPPTVESERAKLKEYKKLSTEMIDNLVAENERLKRVSYHTLDEWPSQSTK